MAKTNIDLLKAVIQEAQISEEQVAELEKIITIAQVAASLAPDHIRKAAEGVMYKDAE